MPDRAKSFREIDTRQNCPRARSGFVKPIQNGLRKVQNLIKCRPTRAETGLAGRENEIRFQKEERLSRPCQEEKEQSRLSRVPDHEDGESQGG